MSQREARQIYKGLLDDKVLLDMFPDLTGDWEKDKGRFMSMYNRNMDALSGGDLDLEEDLFFEDDFSL